MIWSSLGYAGLASLALPFTASAHFTSPDVYPSREYLNASIVDHDLTPISTGQGRWRLGGCLFSGP